MGYMRRDSEAEKAKNTSLGPASLVKSMNSLVKLSEFYR